MMRFLLGCLICCLMVILGCGADSPRGRQDETSPVQAPPPAAMEANPAQGGDLPAGQTPQLQHKIIRTANLRIVVVDLSDAAMKLAQLVGKSKGYVANSSIIGTAGSSRTGTWKVRLPVEAYDQFLSSIQQLGDLQSVSTDSQDVTAEFFDLEARLRNKQQEETRLLKHLDSSTGKLEDILAVEREISRVREEIERMQGRRNLLQDLISMTTITVELVESNNFVPSTPPHLAARAVRMFIDSASVLRTAVTELLLILIALVPWLALATMLSAVYWLGKRILSRRQVSSPSHVSGSVGD